MGRSRSRSRSRERGGRDDHSGGPKGGESTAVLARNLPHDTQYVTCNASSFDHHRSSLYLCHFSILTPLLCLRPEEVRTMFERYGPVSDVYLPRKSAV